MSRRFAWWVLLVAAVLMLTSSAMRRRQLIKPLSDKVESIDRFVDASIALHVVVSDDEHGEYLVPHAPKLRVIRTHYRGGVIDTSARPPCFIGFSPDPVQWYCSEEQEPVILHGDDEPLGQLALGSEGSGKTAALAMWHAFRWVEHMGEGVEAGHTGRPTSDALDIVRAEMFKFWRPSWYRYKVADELFEFCDGTMLRLLSTYRQSAAGGSPIQGFNWWWCSRDEGQDQVEVHEDIESRGRCAMRDGKSCYKQLVTATAKDSPTWRTLRDTMVAARMPDGKPLWIRRTLSIRNSPFVAPDFLVIKAQSMSLREFRRRYDVVDLPPERATYPGWSRGHNLIRIPDIGWEDVTAAELARWGLNFAALAGHDPGALFDVTLIAKAFRGHLPSGRLMPRPFWVVVDEITTEHSTTEQHVARLLERLRDRWHLNLLDRYGKLVKDGPRIFVRADPYGNNDSKPDRACYTVFRNAGIRIEPAAYSVEGTGPGRVPKDAGIEVVNTLFCSAAEERRLFVALDERGAPVAPRLVDAIESEERDYRGKAETTPKGRNDKSHWPAALRYLLWAVERPRLLAMAGGEHQ